MMAIRNPMQVYVIMMIDTKIDSSIIMCRDKKDKFQSRSKQNLDQYIIVLNVAEYF